MELGRQGPPKACLFRVTCGWVRAASVWAAHGDCRTTFFIPASLGYGAFGPDFCLSHWSLGVCVLMGVWAAHLLSGGLCGRPTEPP